MCRLCLFALVLLVFLCHAPSPSNGIMIEPEQLVLRSSQRRAAPCLRLRGGGRILNGLKYLFVQSTSPLPREIVRYLYAQRISEKEIPHDIFQALCDGRATLNELRAWVKIKREGGIARWVSDLSPLLRDRVVLNAKFVFILLCEIVIGCTSKLSAQVMMLGSGVWRRADLVLLSLLLEIVGDFLVVCIFYPAARMHDRAPEWQTRLNPLMWAIKDVPASAFLPGSYSWEQRAKSVILRGAQLFVLSFTISMVGELVSYLLIAVRKSIRTRKPKEEEFDEGEYWEDHAVEERQMERWDSAAMARRAASFASFMGVSCNLRQHALIAMENLSFSLLPSGLHYEALVLLRFINCWLGGILWLTQQRLLEQRMLQKQSEHSDDEIAEEGEDEVRREEEEEQEEEESYR